MCHACRAEIASRPVHGAQFLRLPAAGARSARAGCRSDAWFSTESSGNFHSRAGLSDIAAGGNERFAAPAGGCPMILSHKYKFIFLKTRKTAGTSIEIALSRFCGPDDTLTPILHEDEMIRADWGIVPRNHEFDLADYSSGEPKPGLKFFNHIPAVEARERIGARIWGSYFKFCFERNPWDKVISQFWFDNQSKPDFDSFVRTGNLWSDFDLYTINDQTAVDFVGRYETLAEDLATVCSRLGIPFDGWLPRAKGRFRQDLRPYPEVYNRDQANLVASCFAREIKRFGYRFGEDGQPAEFQRRLAA
jgi:hypothetical protein